MSGKYYLRVLTTIVHELYNYSNFKSNHHENCLTPNFIASKPTHIGAAVAIIEGGGVQGLARFVQVIKFHSNTSLSFYLALLNRDSNLKEFLSKYFPMLP